MSTNGIATLDISGPGNLFIDNGGDNPDYVKVPDQQGSQRNVPTAATGEALTIQLQGGDGFFTADPDGNWLSTIIFSTSTDLGCRVSTLATAPCKARSWTAQDERAPQRCVGEGSVGAVFSNELLTDRLLDHDHLDVRPIGS